MQRANGLPMLTPSGVRVLVSLVSHADDKDGKTWVKQQTIADELSIPRSSIPPIYQELEELGIIHRERGKFHSKQGDKNFSRSSDTIWVDFSEIEVYYRIAHDEPGGRERLLKDAKRRRADRKFQKQMRKHIDVDKRESDT